MAYGLYYWDGLQGRGEFVRLALEEAGADYAAKQRAADFIDNRIPKFLGYFERVLRQNPAGDRHPVGDRLTYVDLSLFQRIEGLHYAFPRGMKPFAKRYPALAALRTAVAKRPNIAEYLKSDRGPPFNTSGVFRHYSELYKH